MMCLLAAKMAVAPGSFCQPLFGSASTCLASDGPRWLHDQIAH